MTLDEWAASEVHDLTPEAAVAMRRALDARARAENPSVNYMDIDEFKTIGFLHEANRQFFHRHGLAIEVLHDVDGKAIALGGVWDYRDDPEGMCFSSELLSAAKAERVGAEAERHYEARVALFGSDIQQP